MLSTFLSSSKGIVTDQQTPCDSIVSATSIMSSCCKNLLIRKMFRFVFY